MMKRLIFSLLLLFSFTLTSCSNKQKTLTIGYSSTLSGQYATVGQDALHGAQIAVDEINENGGINGMEIILEIRDDEANPDKAVANDNELIDMGIDIILGHGLSIVALEVMDNIQDKDVLMISPSMGTDSLSDIDDFLIRNIVTTNYEGVAISNSLVEKQPEKMFLAYTLDNFELTQYHLNSFIDTMMANGYSEDDYITYGFESRNQSQIDYIIDLISSEEYDAAMISSSKADSVPIVNYVIANDIDIDLHLTSWASTGLMDSIATGDFDNIFSYSNFKEATYSPQYQVFEEKFEEKYKDDVHMLAVNGYDIVYMLKEAIESCDSTDPLDIKNEIIAISDFDGISGDFTINEYGDCIREHYQLSIKNGEFVIID